MVFRLNVNGVSHQVDVPSDMPLLWILRDKLDLTGTKFGCGAGLCGACTILADGEAIRACQVTAKDVEGQTITTIEADSDPVKAAVQTAWRAHDAVQCGYCQSGQIMGAVGLLHDNPTPSDQEIREAMNRHICRCCTYPLIRRAIVAAAQEISDAK